MTDEPLVLHSSIARIAVQVTTPLLLLLFGGVALRDGFALVPAAVLVAGLVSAFVVLFDLPLRAEFDADGVTRVCALRRQRLPWSRVVALERFGGRPVRRGDGDTPPPPGTNRGLAARTGPRRVHLLVDRRESHAEWDALRTLLRHRATSLRAAEPPLDSAPAGRGPRALHRRASD